MQKLREDLREVLRANLERVRERMAEAASQAGRDPAEVRLVAVTKTVPAEVVGALLDLGVDAIGEARPEAIVRKDEELGRPVPWHLIGHFQRKKIPKTLPYLEMVHSVHSLELLATLDAKAGPTPAGRRLSVLLQVNLSGERTKQGFSPEETADVVDLALAMTRVEARGLMTMAPYGAPEDELMRLFEGLERLRDEIGRERIPELSMGMSQDFETAIRAGATYVRIGSALFDGVEIGG